MAYQCYVTGVTVSEEDHESILRDIDDLTDEQYEQYMALLGLTHLTKQNPACFDAYDEVVVSVQVHERALDYIFLAPASAVA